jgi:ABC-2 type transport system ATP-binding protein
MNDPNQAVMIEAENLTKLYGGLAAVQDISFACHQGEIVGFLGPNGAGKTTTMRILAGYMPPTSGAAYIAGFDTLRESIEARRNLGYLPETVPLYPEMTVEGYLAFIGRLRQVDDVWDRVDAVLEAVDLLDRAESYIGKLSKGMRQRVGLAQALLHEPNVLILDEPTIGLDPAQIREVRQLITELGKKHTILLSTHILTEVEQICNRVIMVIDGRIWADMPLQATMDEDAAGRVRLRLAQPGADTAQILGAIPGVYSVTQGDTAHQFQLAVNNRDETRINIAAAAVHAGWGLLEMTAARANLETIFLNKLKEAEMARLVTVEDEPPAAANADWPTAEPERENGRAAAAEELEIADVQSPTANHHTEE